MKATFRIIISLMIAVMIVAACAPTGPSPETAAPGATMAPESTEPSAAAQPTTPPEEGGPDTEIVIATSQDIECWNPIEGPCGQSLRFHDLVMDRLFTWSRDGELTPNLATSWELIDDLTWEIKLREGVTFSNGEPFNAEAVQFMYDAVLNPEGRQPPPTTVGSYRAVERIDVIDDYTVRFITSEPFPLLVRYMAFEPRAIPPKYYSEVGMDEFGLKPIGTGPYKLVEWVKNDHFTLEANPDYWGPKPTIQRLIFRPIPEESTRVAEALAGGVDIVERVSSDLVSEVENSDILHKVTAPSLRILMVNLRAEDRLTNQALREAFFYATDLDLIIEEVLRGLGDKIGAGNPVTPYEFGYDPSIPDWPYDPEMAKQKLEEAGYDGHEITLYYPEGELANVDQVAEALQAQWAAVGLNVSIHKQEYGLWRTNWTAREIDGDIHMMSGNAKGMDSDARLVPQVHCYNPEEGLGRVAFFCDPEIDKLIEESRSTMDMEKRQELISEAWSRHRDAAHILTLYAPRDVYGVTNQLEWQPALDGVWSSLVDAEWQ